MGLVNRFFCHVSRFKQRSIVFMFLIIMICNRYNVHAQSMSSDSITFTPPTTSQSTTISYSFTYSANIAVGDTIILALPQWSGGSPAVGTKVGCGPATFTIATSGTGAGYTIVLTVGTSTYPATVACTVPVTGLTNPSSTLGANSNTITAQVTGTNAMSATGITATTAIVSSLAMSSDSITFTPPTTNSLVAISYAFTFNADIAVGATIPIVLPNWSGASPAVGTKSGCGSATFTIATSGSGSSYTITLTIATAKYPQSTACTVPITGLTNPTTTLSANSNTITAQVTGANAMAATAIASATAIVATGTMSSDSLTFTPFTTGSSTTINYAFTYNANIAIGASIKIKLPNWSGTPSFGTQSGCGDARFNLASDGFTGALFAVTFTLKSAAYLAGTACTLPITGLTNPSTQLSQNSNTLTAQITGTNSMAATAITATTAVTVDANCGTVGSCSGHGTCNTNTNKCTCLDGWGGPNDITAQPLSPNCDEQVCPAGSAWVDVPSTATKAHALAECSNQGICDRTSGKCECFDPFEGPACEKMGCPKDCSGHGRCVSMKDMARLSNAMPLNCNDVYYEGYDDEHTWDSKKLFGCVCDSKWTVGFGDGERQLTEWYGHDCSKRRCPGGDDPVTRHNDSNCYEKSLNGKIDHTAKHSILYHKHLHEHSQLGTGCRGASGNACHIECSNRGKCDNTKGSCECYPGFFGEACENYDVLNAGRL